MLAKVSEEGATPVKLSGINIRNALAATKGTSSCKNLYVATWLTTLLLATLYGLFGCGGGNPGGSEQSVPPEIVSASPAADTVYVNRSLAFSVEVRDANGDAVTVTFSLDGQIVGEQVFSNTNDPQVASYTLPGQNLGNGFHADPQEGGLVIPPAINH